MQNIAPNKKVEVLAMLLGSFHSQCDSEDEQPRTSLSPDCHVSEARVLRGRRFSGMITQHGVHPALAFCKASSAEAETCNTKSDYEFPAAGVLRLIAYVLRTDLVHPDQEV